MRTYVQLQHQEQQQQPQPPVSQRQNSLRRFFGGDSLPPLPPTPPPPPPPLPPSLIIGSNERPVTAGHIRSESPSPSPSSQSQKEKVAQDLKRITQELEELAHLKKIGEGVMREQKRKDDEEIAALKIQLEEQQQQLQQLQQQPTTTTDDDENTSAATAAAVAAASESAIADMKARFEVLATNFAAQKKKDDEQISALTRSLEEERTKQRRANDQAANFERAVSNFSGAAAGSNVGGGEKRSWAHADLEARARLDREEIMLLRRKVADTEISSAAKVRELEQRLHETMTSAKGDGTHPLMDKERADKDAKRIAELESFSRQSYAELQELHEQLADATASSKKRAAQLAERAAENNALLKANEVPHTL